MTAEIAIINRSAVTLAADSAMSLQVRGREKIYTSADKLFELCGHHPIGIMVYNTPEFFGVPIELAVKQFREKNKSSLQTVKAASDEFLAFLMKDFAPDANLIAQNIFSVTYAM
ncbi:MAG: hypothetical protein JSS42_08065, partial [Proteobacteria bacterium]|nr:hypothetical protein [Pseudomonadota bacterium]